MRIVNRAKDSSTSAQHDIPSRYGLPLILGRRQGAEAEPFLGASAVSAAAAAVDAAVVEARADVVAAGTKVDRSSHLFK